MSSSFLAVKVRTSFSQDQGSEKTTLCPNALAFVKTMTLKNVRKDRE